ncbi:hypothetical protein T484DRAFT_1839945 [Baffinella frigidus]|nr:hypothetical protein T484DRAFT_1839945 [Cryptophyta sp. CCMP2293]
MNIADLICRPPRAEYDLEVLGPNWFGLGPADGSSTSCFVQRRDLQLTNSRGQDEFVQADRGTAGAHQ